ncbi:hypothetical protein NOVOSPHI9U_290047 [Novosphingobium sp. 9U]|nr:hypothetical protein NOVOSPHI9U_290047 [Novosphingobium sp. 9U]
MTDFFELTLEKYDASGGKLPLKGNVITGC